MYPFDLNYNSEKVLGLFWMIEVLPQSRRINKYSDDHSQRDRECKKRRGDHKSENKKRQLDRQKPEDTVKTEGKYQPRKADKAEARNGEYHIVDKVVLKEQA